MEKWRTIRQSNLTQDEVLALRKHRNRMYIREKRHPGFRQIFLDCGGMCVYHLPDGTVCGATSQLEFHDPFGEDHYQDGRMQQRLLHCKDHHSLVHEGRFHTGRALDSCIQEDIDAEIMMEGGYQRWLVNHGLKDTFGLYIGEPYVIQNN